MKRHSKEKHHSQHVYVQYFMVSLETNAKLCLTDAE